MSENRKKMKVRASLRPLDAELRQKRLERLASQSAQYLLCREKLETEMINPDCNFVDFEIPWNQLEFKAPLNLCLIEGSPWTEAAYILQEFDKFLVRIYIEHHQEEGKTPVNNDAPRPNSHWGTWEKTTVHDSSNFFGTWGSVARDTWTFAIKYDQLDRSLFKVYMSVKTRPLSRFYSKKQAFADLEGPIPRKSLVKKNVSILDRLLVIHPSEDDNIIGGTHLTGKDTSILGDKVQSVRVYHFASSHFETIDIRENLRGGPDDSSSESDKDEEEEGHEHEKDEKS